jgi:hypothetical protein
MSIKLNATQTKRAGAPVGKKTLDSMILGKINNYAPATHGPSYSIAASSQLRQLEGEEYNLADLEGLLHGDRIQTAPQAEEAMPAASMFQEFTAPAQYDFELPAYEEQSDFAPAETEAAPEENFEISFDAGYSEFEANILPIAECEQVEEPVYEGLSQLEAEVLRAQPDPEAPQAYCDDADLSSACPNVMRTRRGTIAFVRHEIGTYINPVYNKCGMLVRVDLNGITLCRRSSDKHWAIVDTNGEDILPAGITAVYFDRQGNLITHNSQGRKMMIGVDGVIHNS